MDLTRSRREGARASGRCCGFLLAEVNREVTAMVPMMRLRKRKRVVGVRVSQLLMHAHSVDWSVMLFCFCFLGFGFSLICKNGNWKVRERKGFIMLYCMS